MSTTAAKILVPLLLLWEAWWFYAYWAAELPGYKTAALLFGILLPGFILIVVATLLLMQRR